MIAGTVRVELDVGDGVCDCPGGPARWSLSQRRALDQPEHVRRAECLGCGRAWEKRLPFRVIGELPEVTMEAIEDAWRGIPAVEVH